MSIFNKNFYPTPADLIEKLLEPYKNDELKYAFQSPYNIEGIILEPSAGKGDIANYLRDNCTKVNMDIYCIEVEPELQEILRSKKFPVIHNDFLTYEKDLFFDFIFMNPPFDNGDKHLLKAIEIASKTKIACILNAETIKNPFSETRKLLKHYLDKYSAKIEFVENAFVNAERKTNVEVALIWLDIDKKEQTFDFDYIKESDILQKFDFDFSDNAVAKKDMINNLKIRFEETKIALIEKIKADAKFEHYINQFVNRPYFKSSAWLLEDAKPEKVFSHFNLMAKKYMWNEVLQELDIKQYMSTSMIKNFDAYIAQQTDLSFNKENVFSLFNMVLNNKHKMIENLLVEVFDHLTQYAPANKMPVPKWKTNSAYKLNKKFIAPCYVSYGSYCTQDDLKKWGSHFELRGTSCLVSLSDLDKILCVLSGKKQTEVTFAEEALAYKFNQLGRVRTGEKYENECYSTFFKIKFHKKGTVHMEFLHEDLWKEFNYQACFLKKWLPDDEIRKPKADEQKNEESTILQLDFAC